MWRADPGGPGPNPNGRRRRCAKVRGHDRVPTCRDRPDLPAGRGRALEPAGRGPGERATTTAAGIPFASIAWGDPAARPLVLIHGVTASAADLVARRAGPGRHRSTGRGASTCRATAGPATGPATTASATTRPTSRPGSGRPVWTCPRLQVVGHSWGAMTAAALPVAGIRPATLVLLDPPAIPHAIISLMASDPASRPTRTSTTARRAVWPRRTRPGRPATSRPRPRPSSELDVDAARAVLLDNGDWDGGLADLSDPAADGIPIWLVRGDPAAGGLRARRGDPRVRGADRGGPHHHPRRARRTPRNGRTRRRRPRPCSRALG